MTKPTHDMTLAGTAARLKASIAWLRDGTPTQNGGIGVADMVAMLPIIDQAVVAARTCSLCGRPPHPVDDPECMPATNPIAEQLAWALGEVARLRGGEQSKPGAVEPVRLLQPQPAPARDVVPGKVRCAKCAFSLQRVNLYLGSGTTGPGGEEVEPCPNDGTPLLPVTWEQEARELGISLEKMFDRAQAAEQALAEVPDYIVATWQYRTSAGFWVECDHDRYISKSARGVEVREVFIICPPAETEGQANG